MKVPWVVDCISVKLRGKYTQVRLVLSLVSERIFSGYLNKRKKGRVSPVWYLWCERLFGSHTQYVRGWYPRKDTHLVVSRP